MILFVCEGGDRKPSDPRPNISPWYPAPWRVLVTPSGGHDGEEEDAGEETEGPLGRAVLERLGFRRTLEWPGLQGALTAGAVIGRDWFCS
jgi:hypothetical protein